MNSQDSEAYRNMEFPEYNDAYEFSNESSTAAYNMVQWRAAQENIRDADKLFPGVKILDILVIPIWEELDDEGYNLVSLFRQSSDNNFIYDALLSAQDYMETSYPDCFIDEDAPDIFIDEWDEDDVC